MLSSLTEFVILGMTTEGEPFNVPGWGDRLCGLIADQGQGNRVVYSNYLHPAVIGGLPAVIMSAGLAKDDPVAYQTIQQFVQENKLKVRSGRIGSVSGSYPAIQERREYIRS